VGGACGMHGRREKSIQNFDRKAQTKETTLKTEDGIIMDLRETDWGLSGFRWLRIGNCERFL
jgi:hypothetical protein